MRWVGGKADLIEQKYQPILAPILEAGRGPQTKAGPSRDDESNNNDNNKNNNNIGGSKHPSFGDRRSETLTAPPGDATATRRNDHFVGSTVRVERMPLASYPSASAQDRSEENPSRRLQNSESSCALGGAFTVSSTVYRDANGCYSTLVEEDPYTFVSTSGFAPAVGDRLVLPASTLFPDSAVLENVLVSRSGSIPS